MALQELPIGGRQSLAADEKIPIEAAIVALNCQMDDDTIRGRNGYRSVTAATIDGTNAPQGMWRFRPNDTLAATIVVIGGTVYKIEEPTTELLSNGTATSLGTYFATTDIVTGTILGRYLYLISNAPTTPVFIRINPDFSVTNIGSLPKGDKPTVGYGTLSIVNIAALTPATAGGSGVDTINTDWDRMTNGSAGLCPVGGSLTYTLTTPIVAADNTWLQVFCTPPTLSAGNGRVKIEVATAAGSFESIGETQDATNASGGGSPNVIWCNLNQLTPTTMASIARIRFTLLGSPGYVGIYGIMYIPVAPAAGTQTYNVSFKNSTTGQRSVLSDNITVTYSSDGVAIPQYHSVYGDRDSFADGGTVSASPDVIPLARNANQDLGLAWPDKSIYAAVATFTGLIPTGDLYTNSDVVELWRLTDTGRRLVKTMALTSSLTTTYTITDDQGSATLMHELYKGGGTPPSSEACAAFAGRIVCAKMNRLTCSNFEPFSALTGVDPYPQFPDIPTIDADGFAFDFAPSPRERIRALVGTESGADVLYMLSNEGAYVMHDMTPNVESGGAQSVPYRIFNRGAVGRNAVCYAENILFWCAKDGIYFAANRVMVDELSKPIRRLVNDWFVPDSTTTMWYRRRKLYVATGTRMLRYDFVKQRWSEGTLSHSPRITASWELDGDTGSVAQAVPYQTLFNDTFTGADNTDLISHSPETGGVWTVHPLSAGGRLFEIESNCAQLNLNNLVCIYYNTTILPADIQITAPILYNDIANDNMGITFRGSATAKTYYEVVLESTTGLVKLIRWNAATPTLLASCSYLSFFGSATVDNTIHTVKIVVLGLQIQVFADSNITPKINFTDSGGSALPSTGFIGLSQTYGRAAPNMCYSSLKVESVVYGGVLNSNTGTQTWLFLSNGFIGRWQEVATSDLMINSTAGTTIPDWIYSTGYLFSPIRFTEDTIFTDCTGPVTVNSFKSADSSNTRALNLKQGEGEVSGWPDFQAYKVRLQFTGANGTQLRRFAWSLGGNDGVGT